MLSLVENVYSVLRPLKTRGVDKHHEEKHDYLGNTDRDSHQKSDDLNIDEEKSTTISIKALLLFLEDFLESRLNSRLNNSETTISPWLNQKQSNDKIFVQPKNAANAYAHAAETKRAPTNRAKQNEEYELKSIYALIKDLRHLQDCNVKHLTIESKEALIKGIFSASDNVKSEKNL